MFSEKEIAVGPSTTQRGHRRRTRRGRGRGWGQLIGSKGRQLRVDEVMGRKNRERAYMNTNLSTESSLHFV